MAACCRSKGTFHWGEGGMAIAAAKSSSAADCGIDKTLLRQPEQTESNSYLPSPSSALKLLNTA